MKYYTVKDGDDLGVIAAKYLLPSWKYLYELNKDKIGDNPDLLKSGIELKIPEWDATQGDEKITQKGGNPFSLTGGVRYRYPWVPFSMTLVDKDNNLYTEKDSSGMQSASFDVGKTYEIIDSKTTSLLRSGTIAQSGELEVLMPDSQNIIITIDGVEHN